ncbi:MAG: tetratricopeptide repeat protein [Betaproteobacteria bacterium]
MTIANQATSQRKLAKAVEMHNRGQLDEAANVYERLVAHAAKAWEPRYLLGLLRFQQGEFAEAQRLLQDATHLDARHADGWFYLGETLAAPGQRHEAEAAYAKASTEAHPHAMASFKLAMLLEARDAGTEAQKAYRAALKAKPEFAEALNNLGRLLHNSGDTAEAEALLRRALERRHDFAPAYINLARLLGERDDGLSIDLLQSGIQACPASGDLHFNLAIRLAARGDRNDAVAHYEQALALNPEHAEAYSNIGVLFLEEGFTDEARICFERAIALKPDLVEASNNLGNVLTQLEQYDAARIAFEHAIAIRPDFADAYNGIGIVLNEQGAVEQAVDRFRAALERRPVYPEAAANLGSALHRLGDLDQARQAYDAALQMKPSVALRIAAACMLPPIPHSNAELLASRDRLGRELDALIAADLHTTEHDLLAYPDVSFYLAYHGMNDRALLEKRAQLFAACCPSLLYTAAAPKSLRAAHGAIRIGFVSRFFHHHSVGNFFNPIIEHLAQLAGFEVYLFGIGFKQDETLRHTAQACREYVQLAPWSLQDARDAIEQRELDILVYADIGMDPFTYFLSFSRLASKQCVLQGHSETSGVSSLDYFVSSRLIEPPDAQSQYTEHVLLLDEMPMVLRAYPPLARSASRAQLGLPQTGRLYVCPMKLHKIHPDMDVLVAGILSGDSEGFVLFFEEDGKPRWSALIRERLQQVAPVSDLERVVFLPYARDFERFRAIIATAAIALDTPHHSGGTTCNICISVGTPIVSIVGATCRGRAPASFYALMGLSEGIVDTADAYVASALAIAKDPARRAALSAEIVERSGRILRNAQVMDAYRDLFERMAEGRALPGATSEPSLATLRVVSTPGADGPIPGHADALVQQAMKLQAAGELAQAKDIYVELLHANPDHADAWHLLGVIALQVGDAHAALPLIGRAIELDSQRPAYFNNLGNALYAEKKLDDAEAMYRHAIQMQPQYAQAIYNRGNTLHVLQRYDEALACYEEAVRLRPDYSDALFSAAGLFQARGEYEKAREWYARVLAIDPSYIDAHLQLGRRLYFAGMLEQGVAHYREYQRLCSKYLNITQIPARSLQLMSVKQWCSMSGARYEMVRPEVQQHLVAPQFSEPPPEPVPASTGTLHELYLAEIHNATVIGWHDVVLTESDEIALYDMATRNPDDAIEVEHGFIRYASSGHLLMNESPLGTLTKDRGVLIAGRGRDSFAHWVIDFLPRLWLLDQFPEYDDWPLLVDAGLYPQQLESLQALNCTRRPVIELATHTRYKLERVVLLSDLSTMRRQNYRPFARPSGGEVAVSEDALAYLRQHFARAGDRSGGGRRLYISRLHQSQFRRMTNELEVERLLASHGFEIVYPEQHTFAEQARLFSEASVLAGPGGSNMINSIFAPTGARILLFTQWHPAINYYFFSHLAQFSGHRLEYVLGEVTQRHAFYYQNDFVIDLAKIERALAALN